jgi:phosphoenolpyruvate carboxykinase (ATP)
MPRHPAVYGNLLRSLIAKHKVKCWMVNTGWTGGPHGVGRRMPIKVTRALLSQALEGKLDKAPVRLDPWFGFEVPLEAAGIDAQILSPRDTWGNNAAYDNQARRLVQLFINNFEPFEAHVDPDVKAAAPRLHAVSA